MGRKNGEDRGIFEDPPGSGRWYACWADWQGKTRRKMVGSKTAARAYYLRMKDEARHDRLFPEEAQAKARARLTVSVLIERYRSEWERKASAADDARYAEYWKTWMGDKPLSEVTPG